MTSGWIIEALEQMFDVTVRLLGLLYMTGNGQMALPYKDYNYLWGF